MSAKPGNVGSPAAQQESTHSVSALLLACAYCEHEGLLEKEIEIRYGKFVCKDTAACDAREAKLNGADNDAEE